MTKFATRYTAADGYQYCDVIEAASWGEAQRIADARDRGEEVVGSNVIEIADADMTPEKADEICAAMNASDRSIKH